MIKIDTTIIILFFKYTNALSFIISIITMITMITIPSDSEFLSMRYFPHSEGPMLEFKKSTKGILKIEATLCAFLNTEGGHLICGVRDDRTLEWMDMEEKEIDLFLSRIDSIISNRIIRAINGDALPWNSIKSRVIKNTLGQYIIVLTAIRCVDTTYTYKGNRIYRLNVSNFYATSVSCYTESEVTLIKDQIRANSDEKWQIEMRKCLKNSAKLEKTLKQYEFAYSKMKETIEAKEKEIVCSLDMLHKRILAEKEFAEEYLAKQKCCSLFYLLCGM